MGGSGSEKMEGALGWGSEKPRQDYTQKKSGPHTCAPSSNDG